MNSQGVRLFCLFSCLLAVPVSFGGELDTARAAADALSAIRGAGKACPPSWSNAAVEKVERLGIPSGTWHLARVAAEGKPAGYVLLLQQDNTLTPVMYSESQPPTKLMEHLSATVALSRFEAAPLVNRIAGVPMIAIPKPRSDRLRVTPLACCVAGMAMWFQAQQRVPLFFLHEEFAATRPFDMNSPFLLPAPQSGPVGELTAFYEQRSKILLDPENSEPLPPPAGSLPWGAPPPGSLMRTKDHARLFEQLSRLLHSTLTNNLSRSARREVVEEERGAASGILVYPWSDGMVSAVVVHSYLTGHTLEQGLERFARSRGIFSPWSFSRPAELVHSQLPCVLYGPGDQALVVTGVSEDTGSRWITIVAPETVRTFMRSRLEVENEGIARFRAMNPGQPTAEESMLREHPEKKEEFERLKKDREAEASKEMLAFDVKSGSLQASSHGEHVARLDLFGDWQVVSLRGNQK